MKEGFLELEDERAYVLRELEIFNWGPFAGKHRAEFDERGTAIIGATGSGKTTLVDALMTLLADNPRYNLASTGGHDKNDRTLLSYVRGVGGSDLVSRPGKTVTGIGATYENSRTTLRAGAILWIDSTSNSQQDLKRRWFFTENEEQTLDVLLRQWQEDGARQLMKYGRETPGLRIFESKKAYLAHLRKVFDVGENAFNLLNRAAGLKQLDSVDTIFRELVLDDKSAFSRALEVASDFDNLAAIHKELEDARRQQESLLPLHKAERERQKLTHKLHESRTLKDLVPRWYAGLGEKLWSARRNQISEKVDKQTSTLQKIEGGLLEAVAKEDALRERFLKSGGSDIEQLEQSISLQTELLKTRRKKAEHYQTVVKVLQLNDSLDEGQFDRNLQELAQKRPHFEAALEKLEDEEAEARSEARQARQACQQLEQEIREVKGSPGSNVPPNFQNFRRALAQHLKLENDDLPFVAELVEVRKEEAPWRGAIERAIGSNRLRILVPREQMRDALHWVNGRENRLHVRLQEARLDDPERDYFHDSYIHKLNIKEHPLKFALENLLASQDYHCVDDTELLRETEHGLTKEGTMSGRGGRFDKQDQRRLSEGWLTGFDNSDQLNALARELLRAQEVLEKLEPAAKLFLKERNDRAADLRLLEGVIDLEFSEVDVRGTENQLAQASARLEQLRAPNSDTKAAQEAYETSRQETEVLRKLEKEASNEVAVLRAEIARAEEQIEVCLKEKGDPLSEQEKELTSKSLRVPEGIATGTLLEAQRIATREVEGQIERRREGIGRLEKRLISGMEKARSLNPGPYVDAGADLIDIPIYLDELDRLEKEALPEKERRFLDYLNVSSDQGVTQLLAQIDQEVTEIEDRIKDLNVTLAKVDYRGDHYLQLHLKKLNDTSIRALESARRKLRSAVLTEDGGQSHFQALQEIVMILREAGNNRHLVGSRALLDPRYRLEFRVVEVNRKTGATSGERSGSQSGSGGEKELMSSHILTASLSYALCPSGASRPLYGTVVLDEAFSKSSQSAARLIVDALRVFGLYPVFVTPNKEISLLKQHTRRAICVQRLANGSSIATMTWEKLADLQPGS